MDLRTLLPFETVAYEAHLLRLDAHDRAARFEAALTDGAVSRYVSGIDMRRDLLIGLFDAAGTLRGAAHVARAGTLAELGLSVERAYRGRGHGGRLLERAVATARFRCCRLTTQCLSTNRWMVGRMERLGCRVVRDRETAVGTMALPPADLGLALRVAFDEQAGWLGYGTRALMRPGAWTPAPTAA